MSQYVIDGRQLCGDIGGVQRYIREIVSELDKISKKNEYQILIPKGEHIEEKYINHQVVEYGMFHGLLWEQLDFPLYLLKKKKKGLWLCTIISMLYPKGIVTIHDVMMAKVPELKYAIKNPFTRNMLFLNYRIAATKSEHILTVSHYSKREIMDVYHIPDSKVTVLGSSWQHMKRIVSDDTWQEKYPSLKSGEFYFSLSANRVQKNFKWIYEVAKRNPQSIFAIAGTQEEWQKKIEYDATNIIHLGYISDAMIKSLMENCKAFLFPSTHEGFGLPPLEALSVGARIIMARSSCLPEVYEDSVCYIDPYVYDINLEKVLMQPIGNVEKVLQKYSWENDAKSIYELTK